ncbi:MAG: 16S rRNA (guanine(527)-N(7))-methyltransferase RsmG [Pseudomonadota bacterium]
MLDFKNHLTNGSKKLGIDISPLQILMMEQYAKELMIWNKKINLTAIKDPLQVAEKHFIDSIAVMPLLKNGICMMDMGSGGGFPGIVIKIMNPSIKVVLIDSVSKKVSFLKHIVRLLNLENIDAVHSRVQDLHNDENYAGQFDAIISRAFADLSKYVGLARPFINPCGCIFAMKGKQGQSEVTSEILENYKLNTEHYWLPFDNSKRSVIQMTIRS